MYNLLIAIAAGIAVTLGAGFLVGGGELRIWYGLFPGLLTMAIVYVVLARRSMKQVQEIVGRAQRELEGQRVDAAIATLKQAYPISKWQFMVRSQVDAQIGSILYMTKKFDASEPYLKRAYKKNWVAQAMLGALYYKRKKFDEMKTVFEQATLANKKESLLWNLYAYCVWKSGDRNRAIEILNRALAALPNDQKTQSNLTALKNDKKMKMRSWNLQWYQFHLDSPPPQRQNMPFRRR